MAPRLPALLTLLVLCAPAAAPAQRPLNLNFERRSVAERDRPWGWSLGWSAFAGGPAASFTLDDSVHVVGERSLRIVAADRDSTAPARALMLQLPAGFARGKTLRLTGRLRTRDLTGRALLLLEAWGDRIVTAADTGVLVGGAGEEHWVPVDLAIRVPQDAAIHSVVIMTAVHGAGTAWFDGLELRLGGRSLTELPSESAPATGRQLAWLGTRAEPLREVGMPAAGGADDADLALFGRIVGDARVVGLGESTHGTSEFFQLKHRLLEYLVRRQGFTVFAVETNQLSAERLNAYVQGGPGTAREAMRVMFRVWNTEEMLALVEWMRSYNMERADRPLRFIGYDMQDQQTPADSLESFLRRVEPLYLPRFEGLTREYREQRSYATPQLPEATRARWGRQADTLWRELSARRGEWLAGARGRADTVEIEWAVHAADLWRQAAQFNVALNSPERDSLMAANLDWALLTLYPASRAVVWAHDVHVSHGGDAARSFNGGAQMGAHLKHTYRHDYRAFSLLTQSGQYSATRSFTDHTMLAVEATAAPAGSMEALLASLPRPAASAGIAVDLRVHPGDRDAAWLWQPRPVRSIGFAAFDYGFEITAVMPLEFDGVFLIPATRPSRLL